jgi:hypothetical protein
MKHALLAPLVAAVSFATPLVRADYVAPQTTKSEPEVTAEGEEGPAKPGKRRFYVVEVEEEERPTRHFTLTMDPLELLYPAYAFHAEIGAAPEFGIGLIGAFGTANLDHVDPYAGPTTTKFWQLGMQGMYYAQGSFGEGGLQVGAEVLYTHANLDGPVAVGTSSTSGLGAGLVAGPLVGFKIVTRAGFTFNSQIAIGMFAQHQRSSDPNAPSDDRAAVLLGHLLIGWTF